MHQTVGAAAASGDADWMQPGSGALTPASQPDRQEGDLDELLERWEAMMDADADPLEIMDHVWSSIEGEQVLFDLCQCTISVLDPTSVCPRRSALHMRSSQAEGCDANRIACK